MVHCAVISDEDLNLKDPMLSKSQSVWGYETNFGSFAEYSIVKISQLIKNLKILMLFLQVVTYAYFGHRLQNDSF